MKLECSHNYHRIIDYLENPRGSIEIHICKGKGCNEIVGSFCRHTKKNTWINKGREAVICRLCGDEVT